MSILSFNFNYDCYEAELAFRVDTTKFTPEVAKSTLEFFSWDTPPDPEGDPIAEAVNKYALECLWESGFRDLSVEGVINSFKNKEGYCQIDGSMGITLTSFNGMELMDSKIAVNISRINNQEV